MIKKQQQNLRQQRLYTQQEVIKLYKKQLQSKIIIFKRIIQEKEQTINYLSQQLKQNQSRIQEQEQVIKNIQQKLQSMPSTQHSHSSQQDTQNFDQRKYKQILYSIASIKIQSTKSIKNLQKHLSKTISKLQKIVIDTIQLYKSKSNQYWQSIKNALNKIHKRIQGNQSKLIQIDKSIKNIDNKIQQSKQFEKCRNVLRKFEEIREYVHRIQQNCDTIRNNKENQLGAISNIQIEISKDGHLPIMQFYQLKQDRETPTWGDNTNFLQLSRNKKSQSSAKKTQNSMLSFTASNVLHMTSLLNLSMESRKSMMDNCKQRLIELIQAKQLQKPIKCYLDPINYVKVATGNYLFDLKGNMFKISKQLFNKFQKEGLIQYSKQKEKFA